MNKITLVTGGSRSGKSTFAESLFKDTDDVLYVATAIITDEEMRDRINKHINSRNNKWTTYEGFKDLEKVIKDTKHNNVLLDCVTIMITNLMFEKNLDFDNMTMEEVDEIQNKIKLQFENLIKAARKEKKNLVMVTNEVGSGLVPEYKLGRIYRDIAGFTNQHIAKLCDEVYFTACGLPLKLK
ncbi:adenosylcobinamide kinase/adenosylcobinamide-phosphate guanylyltransferase [Clostridium punense]|uniref:Adenosylcobinamide kinase n=2 Tax=root TaxID=1 RepID=A0ABS4K4K2_9CLOT|nr:MULTISPECIES: bifunctional adenosylcobinamide kinase/adenosylcobinamide-phosphate guanylyltransferase [Clostridium]EQB88718.1 hypothetical protein M918_23390 [Clostridium sp. BL8]MBP2022191.1 adenosylcobinamide kinase/adenosylcobinamide-phosphate guanylyltransferase [Clostridium punense]